MNHEYFYMRQGKMDYSQISAQYKVTNDEIFNCSNVLDFYILGFHFGTSTQLSK